MSEDLVAHGLHRHIRSAARQRTRGRQPAIGQPTASGRPPFLPVRPARPTTGPSPGPGWPGRGGGSTGRVIGAQLTRLAAPGVSQKAGADGHLRQHFEALWGCVIVRATPGMPCSRPCCWKRTTPASRAGIRDRRGGAARERRAGCRGAFDAQLQGRRRSPTTARWCCKWPMVAGIDGAGRVLEKLASPQWRAGDAFI